MLAGLPLIQRGLRLWRNPLFRQEAVRHPRSTCAAVLLGTSFGYVLLFATARIFHDAAVPALAAVAVGRDFAYGPWLLAGGLLLSLSAHWLVPPFLLPTLRLSYELRTLVLMVRSGLSPEQLLAGQVAAGVLPLALGAAPLLLGLPLLAVSGTHFLLPAGTALLAAAIWGGLATTVSLWAGVTCRRLLAAGACAYALTSLALPLLVGAVSLLLALGCSAGRANPEAIFLAALSLTWGILVVGLAAAFWDATFGRLFPEKRHPLWEGGPPTGPEEI